MRQTLETRAKPTRVWEAWEQQHRATGITQGTKGVVKKFHYQFVEVIPFQKFTLCWKTLFVRLYFIHEVKPSPRGSEITYSAKLTGLFAWPVRLILGRKIEQNLGLVLRALVRGLDA